MAEPEAAIREDVGLKCFHCGQSAADALWEDDKPFCCAGCKAVYGILKENNLCTYYALDESPGVTVRENTDYQAYAYLDDPSISRKLLAFRSDEFCRMTFSVPAVHCVSCIWLLENLQKLHTGILRSTVNFPRKTVTIDFHPGRITLGRVASLLASLGYVPVISLDSEAQEKPTDVADKQLLVKLAVAGFCFGNVMLFSFPEYLGLEDDLHLKPFFSWLNILLSLPVLLFSDVDYLKSAWKSFRQRQINIDVPIAVGLIALFLRSVWDILTGFGPGYLDSFTGLVFFLLIGRWFQNKTYENLAFDRDYKSYFPLAVHKRMDDAWKPVVIYDLLPGDTIRIRHMEVVPADAVVVEGDGFLDYSFVTGESRPVPIRSGDKVYAGGRLIGQPVVLEVEKKTSQSHLTSLWNHDIFKKEGESRYKRIIDHAARKFTWAILVLTLLTALYWYSVDPSKVWLIVTSVLVVACPCALALTAPFTYGNMLRHFGRHGLYLKNADVIERMGRVNALVLDKTGTITHGKKPDIQFIGNLSDEELAQVKYLCSFSTHPYSTWIAATQSGKCTGRVTGFSEIPGRGIEARVNGKHYRIGSASFAGGAGDSGNEAAKVFVTIDGEVRGYFQIRTSVRKQIREMIRRCNFGLVTLLSGDNDADRERMRALLGKDADMLFHQSPHDKLNYIRQLQCQDLRVLMLGDGLNDSGALKQADVGIAVTDDAGIFTPSCDGIIHGSRVDMLDRFVQLARTATAIVKGGFVLSLTYNAIALAFAVSGHLTPLVAAILMPLSSISVVVYATGAVHLAVRRRIDRAEIQDELQTTVAL